MSRKKATSIVQEAKKPLIAVIRSLNLLKRGAKVLAIILLFFLVKGCVTEELHRIAERQEVEQAIKKKEQEHIERLTPLSSYREYNLPKGTCTPVIKPAEGSSYLGWRDPDGGPLQDGCGVLYFNGSTGIRVCDPQPKVDVDAILGGPGRFKSLKICSEAPRLDVVVYAEFY